MFNMYIPQLGHSGSRLDKLRKPNSHEAPPWLAHSGKFWKFCLSKLSEIAFSNSFLPLLLRPFFMICESMLYSVSQDGLLREMLAVSKYRLQIFWLYIYLRPLQSLTCLACVAGPQFYGGPDLQRAGFWRAWGRIEGLQERPPFMTTHN